MPSPPFQVRALRALLGVQIVLLGLAVLGVIVLGIVSGVQDGRDRADGTPDRLTGVGVTLAIVLVLVLLVLAAIAVAARLLLRDRPEGSRPLTVPLVLLCQLLVAVPTLAISSLPGNALGVLLPLVELALTVVVLTLALTGETRAWATPPRRRPTETPSGRTGRDGPEVSSRDGRRPSRPAGCASRRTGRPAGRARS